MTVRELIEVLRAFDAELPVYGFDGTDRGCRPIAVYLLHRGRYGADPEDPPAPFVVIDVD